MHRRRPWPETTLTAILLGAAPSMAAAGPPIDAVLVDPIPSGGARAVGLFGALVGLGDDAAGSVQNPAALLSLPRSFDISAATGTDGGARPTFVAVGFHPYRWLGGGLVYSRSQFRPVTDAEGVALPARFLSSVSSFGGQGGLRVGRRLAIGGEAIGHRATPTPTSATSPSASGRWSFGWAASAFFRPDNADAPRVGLAFRHGLQWRLGSDAASGPGVVRVPSVYSTGVSYHYDILKDSRLLFTAQADLVRYSELKSARVLRPPHDDLDARLGVELTIPRKCRSGCGSMTQVRAGVGSRAPVPFALALDPDQVATGQGPSRTFSWAVGASYSSRRHWLLTGKLKLEAGYDRRTRSFVLGLGLRYPEAYRADLQHHPQEQR